MANGNQNKRRTRKAKKAGKAVVVVREKTTAPSQKSAKRNNPAPGLLRTLGGAAGKLLGGPVGSILGAGAGEIISRITGFGDYQVNNNTIMSGQTIPSFRADGDGVEICHREFLADIQGSTAFTLSRFAINPGLFSMFPWLSQVASNFEQYEMLGLVFEYRPVSSTSVFNSSPNGAMGVVIMATDYNVLAPAFQNKQQMESYEFSTSCVPYQPMLHPVECKSQSNPLNTLWVRSQSTTNGDDRLYDLGQFEIATQGMQARYLCGELWVTYHVKLKKPRISPSGLGSFAHIHPVANDADSANILGLNPIVDPTSNLYGVTINDTNSIVISQPGNYLISESMQVGGSDCAGDPGMSFGGNITAYNAFGLNDANSSVFSHTADVAIRQQAITVTLGGTGSDNVVTFSGCAAATAAFTDIYVLPIPYAAQ